MVLLIDNYDSFTYNLYQYLAKYDEVMVIKNDELSVSEINKLKINSIVISPGPCYPSEAGICEELILKANVPILGICLGHQAIIEAYGGKIVHAKRVMHGKVDSIKIDNTNKIFKGLNDTIKVGRYHSLIGIDIPNTLKVIGTNSDNEVMGVYDSKREVYGLQFHPESILTPDGEKIIYNFMEGRK